MGRPILFASMAVMALSTGQFQNPVFSDLAEGHWATDGPGVDPHLYAHHDHEHVHDHNHEHHPHAAEHPHHHHLAMDDGGAVEVLHHCEGDGTAKNAARCLCHQTNGLFQQICEDEQFCDPFTGRCQQRSCFDACRFANPAQTDVGTQARDACYQDTCNCQFTGGLTEEQKCQLDCADCGPFPVLWPETPAQKAAKHESVMQDIFGSGLEHASDFNVRAMKPFETLSNFIRF